MGLTWDASWAEHGEGFEVGLAEQNVGVMSIADQAGQVHGKQ